MLSAFNPTSCVYFIYLCHCKVTWILLCMQSSCIKTGSSGCIRQLVNSGLPEIFRALFPWITIMRWVLRSKIHKATVTKVDVDYIGSITIDRDLIERAGLLIGEKVLVVSNTTGERLETYVVVGERGSGEICMNGAAALKIKRGEEIIVMGFELTTAPITPTIILVDKANTFLRQL
jgi:aspartate 1-decarboxylase